MMKLERIQDSENDFEVWDVFIDYAGVGAVLGGVWNGIKLKLKHSQQHCSKHLQYSNNCPSNL